MEFIAVLWTYVLPFFIILTVLVFVHEWGHYHVARRNGVKVEVFSIGFGPELFGWNDKIGTRWKFCTIPLGGYVKMFGDADVASQSDDTVRSMTREEKKISFHHKTVGQRSAIVFAGPFFNYVFAVLVFALLFMTAGQRHTPAIVGHVLAGSAAENAGLRVGDLIVEFNGRSIERFEQVEQLALLHPGEALPLMIRRGAVGRALTLTPEPRMIPDKHGNEQEFGFLGAWRMVAPVVGRILDNSAAADAGLSSNDRILSIDGQRVTTFQEVRKIIVANPEKPMAMRVLRDGQEVTLTVVPKKHDYTDSDGIKRTVGQLGIGVAPPPKKVYAPLAAMWAAVKETWFLTTTTATAIHQMIVGKREFRDLGGPLRIAEMSGDMAQIGPYAFVWFMGALSLSLCLINLVPVPMLDGGHLLFYGIEAIRGKPLGPKAQEYGFRIGMALVLTLMVVVTWNDLLRLFGAHNS